MFLSKQKYPSLPLSRMWSSLGQARRPPETGCLCQNFLHRGAMELVAENLPNCWRKHTLTDCGQTFSPNPERSCVGGVGVANAVCLIGQKGWQLKCKHTKCAYVPQCLPLMCICSSMPAADCLWRSPRCSPHQASGMPACKELSTSSAKN